MSPRCYRCGDSLQRLTLPLARLDVCPACGVELHVCRMCRHYAPAAPTGCDEDDALEVHEKARANFCDYFTPSADAFDGREKAADAKARDALAALFDSEQPPGDTHRAETLEDPEDSLRDAAESLFETRPPK